jgi:hypothetical protein
MDGSADGMRGQAALRFTRGSGRVCGYGLGGCVPVVAGSAQPAAVAGRALRAEEDARRDLSAVIALGLRSCRSVCSAVCSAVVCRRVAVGYADECPPSTTQIGSMAGIGTHTLDIFKYM